MDPKTLYRVHFIGVAVGDAQLNVPAAAAVTRRHTYANDRPVFAKCVCIIYTKTTIISNLSVIILL